MGASKISDHIQINMKMPKPSQEPPAFYKAPNEDSKGCGCSLHLQNKDREQKFGSWVCQQPVTISKKDQDAKPQLGTCSPNQSLKSGMKGYGCTLYLQNQDREPKFRTLVNQRPVTVSIQRSRCQTPVRNLQHPPKPQRRT